MTTRRGRRPGDFARQPHPHGRGQVGEEAALAWLVQQGYRVVERNHRNEVGEIDLVAREGDTLCFVEIKTRGSRGFGEGIEAVGRDKQRRLVRVAALYLALHHSDDEPLCRFDVLGVELAQGGWQFRLIRDAFGADGHL